MVVAVGRISGSPLTIAWYKGEQKLFEHKLEVKSYERAYSIAKSLGRLEPGTYRVLATLEGKTEEIEWEVAGQIAQDSGALPSAASGGSPPAPATSGSVGARKLCRSDSRWKESVRKPPRIRCV